MRRAARLLAWLGLLVAAPVAAQSCDFRHRVDFADGSRGCLTEYPIADRTPVGRAGTVARQVPGTGYYTLVAAPALPQCADAFGMQVNRVPYLFLPGAEPATRLASARVECERQRPAATAADCGCRLIIEDGRSPLTREAFERHLGVRSMTADARASVSAPAPEPTGSPLREPPLEGAAAPTPDAEAPNPPATAASAVPDEVAALRRQLDELRARLGTATDRPAAAGPRQSARALVIGNAAYRHLGPLPNPRNDAIDMADKLRSFGIEVDLVLDADRNTLVRALADHQRKAAALDVNILYYAGHGLQVGGTNYIAPVDMLAEGMTAGDIKLTGVAVSDALEYLPARTRLVFLDACRDNPVARSTVATRSVAAGRGLAPMASTSGTLISYATRDGAVAEDGQGRNSPYTAALLKHLDAPEDIAVVLRRVRQTVMQATGNRQEPWEYGSLIGDQLILPQLAR